MMLRRERERQEDPRRGNENELRKSKQTVDVRSGQGKMVYGAVDAAERR